MTTQTKNEIQRIDSAMLTRGMDYAAYREIIDRLFAENLVTGHVQRTDYLEYTKLNIHRMNRWDKHFEPNAELLEWMSKIVKPQRWIIITEGWCGDSAQIVPAVVKLASYQPKVTTTLFLRDENPELMQQFLTAGKRSIPIVAALDADGNVLWKWGSRPAEGQKIIDDAKANGEDIHLAKEKLQLWYARNKQEGLMKELSVLISEHL